MKVNGRLNPRIGRGFEGHPIGVLQACPLRRHAKLPPDTLINYFFSRSLRS